MHRPKPFVTFAVCISLPMLTFMLLWFQFASRNVYDYYDNLEGNTARSCNKVAVRLKCFYQ